MLELYYLIFGFTGELVTWKYSKYLTCVPAIMLDESECVARLIILVERVVEAVLKRIRLTITEILELLEGV